MRKINSLKLVFAEQNKTGKWLTEAPGKNEATVSRWCTNEMQPSLETLVRIANALDADVKDLLISTKKKED